MKSTTRALVLAGLCLIGSVSHAVPITRSFLADGFLGGGTLNVSFTGEDTGGLDGVIVASLDPEIIELSDFVVSYSGGTEVGAFTLNLDAFLNGSVENLFEYYSDESFGFAFRSGAFGSAFYRGPSFFKPSGETYAAVFSGCPSATDGSCENFDSNSVPEPTTLSLLGLAMLGVMRRRDQTTCG